ncbi:hypothetical protein H1R20_g7510, partial [Candolleomyces eurysporus]
MAFQQNGSSVNFFHNAENISVRDITVNTTNNIVAPQSQGKSAIAQTLAERYEDEGILGAAFFFDRTSPNRNNPSMLVTTLATQLARYIQGLENGIANAISQNPTIAQAALRRQVDKLIIAPFQSLKGAQSAADEDQEQVKWWIILDGLDECIALAPNRQGPTRKESDKAHTLVLDLVLRLQSSRLPLSFAIFTRPESGIMNRCRQNPKIIEMVDICALPSHEKDVETYLRTALGRIAPNGRSGGEEDREEGEGGNSEGADDEVDEDSGKAGWPDEDRMQQLIDMTRGDMREASKVVKRVEEFEGDPEDELDRILEDGLQPDPVPQPEQPQEVTGMTASAIAGLFAGSTIQQIGNIQLGGTNVHHHYSFPTTNVLDVNLGGSRPVHLAGLELPNHEDQKRLT